MVLSHCCVVDEKQCVTEALEPMLMSQLVVMVCIAYMDQGEMQSQSRTLTGPIKLGQIK